MGATLIRTLMGATLFNHLVDARRPSVDYRRAAAAPSPGIAQYCALSGVCYQLSIPETTASSGAGDIFFQIAAPAGTQWVALGQGNGMKGANMFVVYTSADGQNVTVSPRLGVGHVQPLHDTAAQVSLLSGSGVINGGLVANVQCKNCQSWNGGSMDMNASSADWVYAYKEGSAIGSNDPGATIQQHNHAGSFKWSMQQAQSTSNVSPFNSTTAAAISSQSSSSSSDSQPGQKYVLPHAILACLAFAAFFPSGAILVRLASFTGLVWVHAAIQMIGWLLFAVAFGMGVYIADVTQQTANAHPIIGIILMAMLLGQPLLGLLHHKMFKRVGGRTAWSWAHIGIGRIAIILGMINGGLGLQLAGASSLSQTVTYGVLVGLMGVVYIAVVVFGELRRSKRKNSAAASESDVPEMQRTNGAE